MGSASEPVKLGQNDVFSSGRSSTNYFKDSYFDYNFEKFLGLATYSGSEIAECFSTASHIEDGNTESWIQAWTNTARRVEAYAVNALKGGHKVSAREAWLRATTYYQAAFFFILDNDPRKKEIYEKHTGCFQAAGKLFDPPFEPLAIPYEGKSLFGYFLRCDDKPRPTVLIQMGADGSSEQIYFSGGGAAALRRGYNALIFEGPGQTGTFMRDRSLTYRYDWEVPVKAVVDYALTRREVDPSRIALIAYSMGGYLGPRAVAFEKRIAACIASGLVPSMSKLAGDRLSRIRASNGNYNHPGKWALYEHMPKYGLDNGIDDLDQFEKIWNSFQLYGLEDKIDCPLLVVQAAAEGEAQTKLAREFFEKLPNPKNKFRLTTEEEGAEMHCQKGNAMLLHAIEFDWLDDVLGVSS
jgi:predicted alpha/beta-fold hydrolase